MYIATFLLLVNAVFSFCGFFLLFKLFRKGRKGYVMKFVEMPELPADKPRVDARETLNVVPSPPVVSEEDIRREMDNLTMDDVMAAMKAFGVK